MSVDSVQDSGALELQHLQLLLTDITSCTATAHLAGAMGAKVIVLPPLVPYITWASDTMHWYPDNVVVLRQMEYNNWDKTIEKLYSIVEHELSNS